MKTLGQANDVRQSVPPYGTVGLKPDFVGAAASGRKRLNFVGLLLSVILPWLLFVGVFGMMSSSLHWWHPITTWVLSFVLPPVVLGIFLLSRRGFALMADPYASRDYESEIASIDSTFLSFLIAGACVAWFFGIILGDTNFWNNMQPYYTILSMDEYPAVDPNGHYGRQFQDSGRIFFKEGSRVDLGKAWGYRTQHQQYCVAPVVLDSGEGTPTYDFWAAGINCCSPATTGERASSTKFYCGDFTNPQAHAGLRLFDERESKFFKLAVAQAEAGLDIKVEHPLFFTWMEDPTSLIQSWRAQGVRQLWTWSTIFLMVQMFFVTFGALMADRKRAETQRWYAESAVDAPAVTAWGQMI